MSKSDPRKLDILRKDLEKNINKYTTKLNVKRIEFKRFQIGNIVKIKNKDKKSKIGRKDSHLYVSYGKIISINKNCIIIEDLNKVYKKFTIDINSFIIGDIIIIKQEASNEQV